MSVETPSGLFVLPFLTSEVSVRLNPIWPVSGGTLHSNSFVDLERPGQRRRHFLVSLWKVRSMIFRLYFIMYQIMDRTPFNQSRLEQHLPGWLRSLFSTGTVHWIWSPSSPRVRPSCEKKHRIDREIQEDLNSRHLCLSRVSPVPARKGSPHDTSPGVFVNGSWVLNLVTDEGKGKVIPKGRRGLKRSLTPLP